MKLVPLSHATDEETEAQSNEENDPEVTWLKEVGQAWNTAGLQNLHGPPTSGCPHPPRVSLRGEQLLTATATRVTAR